MQLSDSMQWEQFVRAIERLQWEHSEQASQATQYWQRVSRVESRQKVQRLQPLHPTHSTHPVLVSRSRSDSSARNRLSKSLARISPES